MSHRLLSTEDLGNILMNIIISDIIRYKYLNSNISTLSRINLPESIAESGQLHPATRGPA